MSVSFDVFVGAFLEKITERDLLALAPQERDETVLGYMKRAISGFKKNCRYDLTTTRDDENRIFDVEIDGEDLDEVADIVSEGMIVQWLKPYVYRLSLIHI